MPKRLKLDRQIAIPVEHEKSGIEKTAVRGEPQRTPGAAQFLALVASGDRQAESRSVTHRLSDRRPTVPDEKNDRAHVLPRQPLELVDDEWLAEHRDQGFRKLSAAPLDAGTQSAG